MTQKQNFMALTALCTAVYFISYISRINLAAVMVEMIQSGFAGKHTGALALTACSITHGIALLSDAMGWQNTSLIWTAIAVGGALICLSIAKPWRKFINGGR